MKNLKLLCSCVAALPLFSNAAIIPIFNGNADITNFSGGPGGTGDRGFEASGDRLHIWDLSDAGSINASYDLASPVTNGLRLSFDLNNVSADGTGGISLRFLNAGGTANVTDHSSMQLVFNANSTLSWVASGSAWGSSGTTNNVGSLTFNPADTYNFSLVANTAAPGGDNLTYSYLGDERVLLPGALDLWIDDVRINLSRHLIDNANYDPALGVGRISFIALAAANGPDIYMSNVNLFTGSDITVPEPAVVSLILGLGSLVLVCTFRRRSRGIESKE